MLVRFIIIPECAHAHTCSYDGHEMTDDVLPLLAHVSEIEALINIAVMSTTAPPQLEQHLLGVKEPVIDENTSESERTTQPGKGREGVAKQCRDFSESHGFPSSRSTVWYINAARRSSTVSTLPSTKQQSCPEATL